jgi:transcriptional regulator with XRE-family HTH domain
MAPKERHSLEPSQPDDIPGGGLTPKAISKQEFGRRLHSLLINKGWNQSDLAREAGIGKDSISGYIRGRSFPGPNKLKEIADALGVSKEKLLPNSLQAAMDEELPAFEVRQAVGHGNRVWLRVNRAVSFSTAARIIAELEKDQREVSDDD